MASDNPNNKPPTATVDSGQGGLPQSVLPEQRGPWICHTRHTAYQNAWLSVSHEEVTTPAGTPGIYGVVHFHHTAVGVVALDEQQQITLVGQFRYPLNQFSWEIPEGGAKPQETTLECAQRELQEEAGLSAEHWQPILSLHTSNSVTDESAIVYMATGLSSVAQTLEDTESDLQTRQVALSTAIDMIDKQEITDAISVAAILKVARILNV